MLHVALLELEGTTQQVPLRAAPPGGQCHNEAFLTGYVTRHYSHASGIETVRKRCTHS